MESENKFIAFAVRIVGCMLIFHFIYYATFDLLEPFLLQLFSIKLELFSLSLETTYSNIYTLFILYKEEIISSFHLILALVYTLFVSIIVPVCALIAGIRILRKSESGRKFAIIIFLIDLSARVFFILMIVIRCFPMYAWFVHIVLCTHVILDIAVILFLMNNRVKKVFMLKRNI